MLRVAIAAVAAGLLAACAGNGGGSLPAGGFSATPGAATAAASGIVFTIKVPAVTPERRRSRYVSPYSRSMSIRFETASGKIARTIDQNLTPASPGCTAAHGSTTCTVTAQLPPGDYTALVDTYDGTAEHGSILSEGQSLPLSVVAKKRTTLSLALGGIPHALRFSGGARTIRPVAGGGLSLYGPGPQPVIVTAEDADSNIIVGADSLRFSAAVASGSGWAVQATPNPNTPNTLTLTPPGINGATASLAVTFAYSQAACAQAGAICNAHVNAANRIQLLAVAQCAADCGFPSLGSSDAVLIYRLPNVTTPVATVTSGVVAPRAVAIGPDGTLFVANCLASCSLPGNDDVTVYAPPYASAPVTIGGVDDPTALAVDPGGDLFVEQCLTCHGTGTDSVSEYAHGAYSAPAQQLASNGQIAALATDASGDLLMAACLASCGYAGADAVLDFAPPYASATALTNTVNDPTALALDPSGNLYVANCENCATTPLSFVAKYAAPFSGASAPAIVVTGNASAGLPPYIDTPRSLATDSAGDLFVGNAPAIAQYQGVTDFPAPDDIGKGTQFLSGYAPYELQMDALNDLVESSGATVEFVAPPYTAKTHVVESGIATKRPFAIGP